MKIRLAAAGALFLVSLGGAQDSTPLIRIASDLKSLPVTGVPFLNEDIPEILSDGEGLSLIAGDGSGWARTAAEFSRIPLRLSVDSGRFDHAVFTIWNWHNRPVRQIRIEPSQLHSFEIEVEGRGVWLVTLDGYQGGECTHRLVRSVAWTEDLNWARSAWKREEFLLGVCSFPGRYHWAFEGGPTVPDHITGEAALELEADLLARLGFQAIRVDESMEMGLLPEDAGGGYEFNFDRMDAVVKAYTGRGLELAFQLMNPPDWAIADKYREREPPLWIYPRKGEYVRLHTRSLLDRYGRHARFVQVYNEPDQETFWGGTPGEFLDHFAEVAKVSRELLPEVPLLNGGYSLVDRERTRFFAENLKERIDVPAYHSHGTLEDLKADHALVQKIHAEAGYEGERFLNTEMGFDGWRLDQERRKGQVVAQKTLYCWSTNHSGVLLFGGRMTIGPEQVTQDFGFLDFQFCPRFVYGSIAGLVSVLAGASFEKTLIDDGETHAYLFRKGQEKIVAAFALGEEGCEIEWESDAVSVIRIDEMGNRKEGSAGNRMILDGYPRYLVFEEAREVQILQPLK